MVAATNSLERAVRALWIGDAHFYCWTRCRHCGEIAHCCGKKRKAMACLPCFDARGEQY